MLGAVCYSVWSMVHFGLICHGMLLYSMLCPGSLLWINAM